MLIHRRSAVRQALGFIRIALDSPRGDQYVAEAFLSCFVKSLHMVDQDTRHMFLEHYKKTFPEFQFKCAFPDTDTFLNYFYEMTDEELLDYVNDRFPRPGKQRGASDILLANPERTADLIGKLDENFEGVVDLGDLIAELEK